MVLKALRPLTCDYGLIHSTTFIDPAKNMDTKILPFSPLSSIEARAKALGFASVGFSRAQSPVFFKKFLEWVASGKHGEMSWLGRNIELRKDPARLLEGCRTIISLAYPYAGVKPCTPEGFAAARFTEPYKDDYHQRLRGLAKDLCLTIRDFYPETRVRVCVDSAPILERSFAYASGIGFVGKNNMLVIPGYGSYLFLVEILTDALLPFLTPEPMSARCGSCSRCLDACPTGALEAPFSLNASKCLSYLTIEYRGSVDKETAKKMGRCFFGCDICQEVCPFNEEQPSGEILLPQVEEILGMDEKEFQRMFGKTAFARPGLQKIKQNLFWISR